MKKLTLVLMVLVLSVPVFAAAQDEVKTTFSMDFVSKYMNYGIDSYNNDDPAFQPSLTFDFGNGFSAQVWGSWSFYGGHENSEELDYSLAYSFSLLQDDKFQADMQVDWKYCDLYDGPSNASDSQEYGLTVAFPNLLEDGFVPHYRVVRIVAEESSQQPGVNGWVHIFGFTKGFSTQSFIEEGKSQDWLFSADVVYNDSYVISDTEWTHAVFSLAAPMDCPFGGKITPSISYQKTMEKQTDTEDEFYFGVNYTIDF